MRRGPISWGRGSQLKSLDNGARRQFCLGSTAGLTIFFLFLYLLTWPGITFGVRGKPCSTSSLSFPVILHHWASKLQFHIFTSHDCQDSRVSLPQCKGSADPSLGVFQNSAGFSVFFKKLDLIHNIVPISAAQQNDSTTLTHTHIFSITVYPATLDRSPCAMQ